MNTIEMIQDLRGHQTLCQELLAAVEREALALRGSDSAATFDLYRSKKTLLPQLDESVAKLKQHRVNWQRLPPTERAQNPEIAALIQLAQELIMKIIVLDRENEQALLRKGLVPARQLPSAHRQRPHFVSDLYRRQGGA